MTIFGWDMSHFDNPDIGTAVAQGIKFITHKAGGDATDVELPAWWAGVKGLDPSKVLLGAYWVLYPGNPLGRANLFINRLDAACPGWRDRPFLLQVDCEKWNGDPGTVPGKADISTFCGQLVKIMPKLRPIVYAPKWVYGDGLTGLGYPLWASSYVTGSGGFKSLYPGDSSSRWNSYSGQTPAILQYTSSAFIDGQTTCDANAYRGTFDQLMALVAPGWSADMALDSNDVKLIWNQDGTCSTPEQRPDHAVNPSVRAAFALEDVWAVVYDLRDALAALAAKVDGLGQAPAVDVAALAAALVTALPALGEGLTEAQVEEALRAVLHGA